MPAPEHENCNEHKKGWQYIPDPPPAFVFNHFVTLLFFAEFVTLLCLSKVLLKLLNVKPGSQDNKFTPY